jgi:maltose-binding protein MalE
MSSPEQQKHTDLTIGDIPTRTALYDDAQLKKAYTAVGQAPQQVKQTIAPPRSPYYKDMSAVMAQQFNANVRGVQTPEETAANVQKGLEDIQRKAAGA